MTDAQEHALLVCLYWSMVAALSWLTARVILRIWRVDSAPKTLRLWWIVRILIVFAVGVTILNVVRHLVK